MITFKIEIKAPYEFLGSISTLHYSNNHGKWSGVYVMYGEDDEVIYVGKSIDISKRLSGHARDSDFYDSVKSLGYYRTVGGYESEILETYLINELKPSANKGKTYFRSSEYSSRIFDLDVEINELMQEIEYLQTDISRIIDADETVCFDGFTIDDEIEPIRNEISVYEDRLAELRAERHTLTMRIRT